MYKIDPAQNRITPLEAKHFGELGFGERQHLQEWLEHYPQALTQAKDDELMIIQKEFDGFDKTRERLDLLAIDKNGNLVIIENKLDDSGRDVVWQALKYAGYCSNLKTHQIIEIFQSYLDKKAQLTGSAPAKAEDELLEFLRQSDADSEDLSSFQLNTRNSQRLIFVACNYRPEVTNTVLWLSQFGVQCQCLKVTPYQMGDDIFLNVEQIIPPPETSEYMIGMMDKEAEEARINKEAQTRSELYLAYSQQVLEAFQHSNCTLFNSVTPSKYHWTSVNAGVSGVYYSLVFGKREVRVELYISTQDAERNNRIFELLRAKEQTITADFGQNLIWQPLPKRKACRIKHSLNVDGYNKSNWQEMISWMVEHMTKLENALRSPLHDVVQQLK